MGTAAAFLAVVGWVAIEGGSGGGGVPTDAGRDVPSRASGGLAGLESALSGTGRIGQMQVQGAGVDGSSPTTVAHRDPVVRPLAGGGETGEAAASQPDPIGEPQMERMQQRVEACRVEVARRRGVTPASVPAGLVTLRWTIEPSGRARDAEAVTATDTDLEVAACAKRVVTEWAFNKPAFGATTVERVFKF